MGNIVKFIVAWVLIPMALCAVSPFYTGLKLGIGTDYYIGAYYAKAIGKMTTEVTKYQDSQETTQSYKFISSTMDLRETMDLSEIGPLNRQGAHMSASASFIKQSSINQYSTYLMVQVYVKNVAENISDPDLSRKAKKFLTQQGLDKFEKAYGTEYLSGIISGGMYLGLVSIDTQSQQEKQDVTVGVRFSGFGASLKMDISQAAQNVLNKRQVEVYSIQLGGQPQALATTLQAMVDQLIAFPDQVLKYPTPILGIFSSYQQTIPHDWPGQGVDYTIRNNVLDILSIREAYLKDRKSDLKYVQENLDSFPEYKAKSQTQKEVDMNQIQKELEEIVVEANAINQIALLCIKNTSECIEPEPSYKPNFILPKQSNDFVSESIGMIMMHFGDLSKIPQGWQLCDGSNGTPDLRGRVAVGELQSQYSNRVKTGGIGSTGGSLTNTLSIDQMPKHTHTMSSNGNHGHNIRIYDNKVRWSQSNVGLGYDIDIVPTKNLVQTSQVIESSSSHKHTIYQEGGSKAFNIVQPFAVVNYICKVG